MAAVDDMEALYRACEWHGRLADEGAGFMKDELKVSTMNKIGNKVTAQPYQVPNVDVMYAMDFPEDDWEEEEIMEDSIQDRDDPVPQKPMVCKMLGTVNGREGFGLGHKLAFDKDGHVAWTAKEK